MSGAEKSRHALDRAECWILTGLLFFLPLFEAPKNVLWGAFVCLWLARAVSGRAGWGGVWSHWRDLPFLLLPASVALACLLAAPFPANWDELNDVLRYSVTGWLLARSRLADRDWPRLVAALLAGTVAATLLGWWRWQIGGTTQFLQLNSVGHTNHSAIFLAMTALIALGALVTFWQRLALAGRAGLVLTSLGLALSVAFGESRGALLSYLVGTLALLWQLPPKRWRARLAAAFALSLVVALVWNNYLIDKTVRQWQGQTPTTASSFRLEMMRTALTAVEQHPLTGVGPGNFSVLTAAQLTQWLSAEGRSYDASLYFHASHAHNLYFNTLAERGLLGVAVLLILALAWLKGLRDARLDAGHEHTPRQSLVWTVGWAGFVGVFVAGLFNTTLHSEHGMLAMMALGLLLSRHEASAAA